VIQGKYRIDGVLAKGGYGVVYEAHQLGVERPAVVKTLLPSASLEDTAFARFEREAQIASRLRHPNTVTVFDFGKTDGNLLYMVMERLEGRPLDKVLRTEGAMHPERARHILSQILEALAEAHSLGVVHRDLKPSNVFLCEIYGKIDFVKVIDFGIAKVKADFAEQKGVTLTESGFVVGTPGYLSPELLAGRPAGPQADLYSIGVIGYELLTGRTAFPGTTPLEKITRQATEDPMTPPEAVTSLSIWPIIVKLIARDPLDRYVIAEDVIAELRRIGPIQESGLAGDRTGFENVPSTSDQPRAIPRLQSPVSAPMRAARPWLPAFVAGAIVVVGIGVALGIWLAQGHGADDARASAADEPPAAEPGLADTVDLRIDSEPPGATVTARGVLVGTTPLVWQTHRDADPMMLQFALPDHVATSRSVIPDRDVEIVVPLQHAWPAAPTAAAPELGEDASHDEEVATPTPTIRRTRVARATTPTDGRSAPPPAEGKAARGDVYKREGIGKKN